MENNVEREISLINLFWKLLLGWRPIVVLGLVCAILISVGSFALDTIDYNNEVKKQEEVQQAITEDEAVEMTRADLTKEEREAVEKAEKLYQTIVDTEDYLEHTVKMQVDPFNKQTLLLQFCVESDYTYNYTQENESDYTTAIMAAYDAYVNTGKLSADIYQKTGLEIEERYLKELIGYSSYGNTFQVSVLYTDSETLNSISKIIQETLNEQMKHIADTVGEHTLKVLSEQVNISIDTNMVSWQSEQKTILENYRTQFKTMEASMTEAQAFVLESDLLNFKANEGLLEELKAPEFSKIMVILGFIVGAFLACAWIAVKVIFTSKMQEPQEMAYYGVRVLGELTASQPDRKPNPIDAFILSLKNRNKKKLTKEQQIKIIGSNLEITCKKADVDKLYLTGSEIEKADSQWISEIKALLQAVGITVISGENVCYDAKSLKEMADVGYVVFMEKIDASLYREVENEIRLARENDIEIIGSIVIV